MGACDVAASESIGWIDRTASGRCALLVVAIRDAALGLAHRDSVSLGLFVGRTYSDALWGIVRWRAARRRPRHRDALFGAAPCVLRVCNVGGVPGHSVRFGFVECASP